MAQLVALAFFAFAGEHVGQEVDGAIVGQADLVDTAGHIVVGKRGGAAPKLGELLVEVGEPEALVALGVERVVVQQEVLPIGRGDDAFVQCKEQALREEHGVGERAVGQGGGGVVLEKDFATCYTTQRAQGGRPPCIHLTDGVLGGLLGGGGEQAVQGSVHDEGRYAVPQQSIERVVLQNQLVGGVQVRVQCHHFRHHVVLHIEQALLVGHEHAAHHGVHITGSVLWGT